MKKLCTKCKTEKDVSEFYKRSAAKDGLHCHCKDCVNQYDKQRDKSKLARKNRKCRNNKKEWFRELKSTLKCSMCSEDHPATLDFHHKDANSKDKDVSFLAARSYSKQRVLEEISKCIILCANCHRKLHSLIT